MRVPCLLFAIGCIGSAQDLDGLRAALESLRAQTQEHRDTRGATPALTTVKHRLRDWAEARLASFGQTGDEDALNRELQVALLNAGLLCPNGCMFTSLGYVDQVRVHHQDEFLTVQTSVGIACGFDDSAYVYAWNAGAWRRIFTSEQNVYTKAGYLPQTIYAVQISERDPAGLRFVMTLGSRPGCSDAFQPLYYRLWRVGSSGPPKLLLNSFETAYMGDYPPVHATLSLHDVRIEFTAGGTGYGEAHQADRHFEIRGNSVMQIEPIAPTPRDFVEEWLAAPWKQSLKLAESASLQPWHIKFHRDDGRGDFPDRPVHCASDSSLWQIGIRLHGVDGKTYYLVRWSQPDHFTMADIADHPLCSAP
jgi:hypothetical protein